MPSPKPACTAVAVAGERPGAPAATPAKARDKRTVCTTPAQPRTSQADAAVREAGHGSASAAPVSYDTDSNPAQAMLASDTLGGSLPMTTASTNPPSPDWVNRNLTAPSAPSKRWGAAMAYDPRNHTVVLFGGTDNVSLFNDTWLWNGSTWTLTVQTGTKPVGRAYSAMAWDAATNQLILFAGAISGLSGANDMWAWNPTTSNWTQLTPSGTLPPKRSDFAMDYLPSANALVVFGGNNDGGSDLLNDTWLYNSSGSWQQVSNPPPSGLVKRYGVRMAYDSDLSKVVMFGGFTCDTGCVNFSSLNDTWTFNGSSWAQPSATNPPSTRGQFGYMFDSVTHYVVLFGGDHYTTTDNYLNDTWLYNGSAWQQAVGVASPSARGVLPLAFWQPSTGSPAGHGIMFGGWDGTTVYGDTWTYDTAVPTVTKVSDQPTYGRGGSVKYTLTIGNAGTVPLSGVSVTDTLPAQLSLGNPSVVTVTGASGQSGCGNNGLTCSTANNQLSLQGMTVPAVGTTVSVTYWATAIGSDRACSTVTNTAVASSNYGQSAPASAPVQVCDTALGMESWWTYFQKAVGPANTAAVNVANGNLVLQQTDGTPVQSHGKLALVLRRTYNSEDMALATKPDGTPLAGSWGAGWVLNVGQADDLIGDGVGSTSLYVPTGNELANPMALTYVDRDGTRHVFQPRTLSAAIDVTSAGSIPFLYNTLKPRVLNAQGGKVCVDQTYTSPPGVHVALWRYVQVGSTGSCGSLSGGQILGYAGERPDRLRYEFAADGSLVDMRDGAGNELTYAYDNSPTALPLQSPFTGVGKLRSVTDIAGRAFTFTYPSSTESDVTDPAGRTIKYTFDATFPSTTAHLTRVQTLTADGTLVSDISYTYGGCGGGANQMCSVTDPRAAGDPNGGHVTRFTYTTTSADGVTFSGPAHVSTIGDRRPTNSSSFPTAPPPWTVKQYANNTDYTTVTRPGEGIAYKDMQGSGGTSPVTGVAGEGMTYKDFDSVGRVGEIDAGSDNLSQGRTTITYQSWDGVPDPQDFRASGQQATVYCRLPGDTVRDNNLCRSATKSLDDVETGQTNHVTTHDADTAMQYNAEGMLLAQHRCIAAPDVALGTTDLGCSGSNNTLDTTTGYHVQYVETKASLSNPVYCFNDSVAGGGTVNATQQDTSTGCDTATPHTRNDSSALFAIDDTTQTLPPNGNDGSGGMAYLTTYKVDDLASQVPNTFAGTTATLCSSQGAATTNSGVQCESDQPAFGGTDVDATCSVPGSSPTTYLTCTRYTYDGYGERATMTTPKQIAEQASASIVPYEYVYYADTDTDLSGSTKAGGWIKAVVDPTSHFVAFAYDRAGNVARTWDRNATAGVTGGYAAYPGTMSAPPAGSGPYTETLHGARGVTSPYTLTSTPYSNPWLYPSSQTDPLGDKTTYVVDADGNQTSITPPRGNVGGGQSGFTVTQTFDAENNLLTTTTPASGQPTTRYYDSFNDAVASTDPNGKTTASVYDATNRPTATFWTRGGSGTAVPAACHTPAQSGDPYLLPSSSVICSTTTSYDGTGNVVQSLDGNHVATATSFDGVHRKTKVLATRSTSPLQQLETDYLYDFDGNVTDTCPPREFNESNGAHACSSTAPYSQHVAYDKLDRKVSTTTYQQVSTSTPYVGQSPSTSTVAYDADGNLASTTDPDSVSPYSHPATTYAFNYLDRKTSMTVPRSSGVASTTSWVYDFVGNVTALVQPGADGSSTRVTAYSFDADNRVVDTVTGSDNQVASLAGQVDSAGGKNVRSRVYYDPDGHVVAVLDPRAFAALGCSAVGAGTTATPDACFMVRTDIDADGRTTAQYLPRYAGGAFSDITYTGAPDTQTSQCPAGTNAPTTVNVSGTTLPAVPAYTSAIGLCVTRVTYDADGNRSQVTLPTNTASSSPALTVNYTYTDDNLVSAITAPSPAASTGSRTTVLSYVYDADRKPVQVTDALGHTTTTVYTADELTQRVTPQQVYNTASPAQVVTPHVTTFAYDTNGNQTQATVATGCATSPCATDSGGNATNLVTTTTTSVYDPENRLTDTITPDPLDAAGDDTHNVYDPAGNRLHVYSPSAQAFQNSSVKDANVTAYIATDNTYTYDNLPATTAVPVASDGSTYRLTTYGYDPAGRKTSQQMQYADGTANHNPLSGSQNNAGTEAFTYFQDDRMASQAGREASGTKTSISYTYDAAGNRASVGSTTSAGVTSTIQGTYYLDGRPRTVDEQAASNQVATAGRATEFAYDGAGNIAARFIAVDPISTSPPLTTPSQKSFYTYGDAELPSSMSSTIAGGLSASTTWSYFADGMPQSKTEPNGLQLADTYNADDTLATQALTNPSPATTVARWCYTYDALYRQLSQTNSVGSDCTTGATFSYTYDVANRLASFSNGATTQYCWNHDGDRTTIYTSGSCASPVGAQTYTYNADDSIRRSPTATSDFTYSPAGLLTNDTCTTYGYDGLDRLSTASTCHASSTSYTYDGLDRQTSHTEGSTLTALHYDGWNSSVALEVPGSSSDTAYELDPSGGLLALTSQAKGTQYLDGDGQGNITTVSPSSSPAAATCTMRYDPFGATLTPPSTCTTALTPNTYFFRGARQDQTTGDYQFGSRTYDPSKATFLTPDSYRSGQPQQDVSVGTDPLTRNTYSYVNGDPVNLVDPTGHDPVGSFSDASNPYYYGKNGDRPGPQSGVAAFAPPPPDPVTELLDLDPDAAEYAFSASGGSVHGGAAYAKLRAKAILKATSDLYMQLLEDEYELKSVAAQVVGKTNDADRIVAALLKVSQDARASLDQRITLIRAIQGDAGALKVFDTALSGVGAAVTAAISFYDQWQHDTDEGNLIRVVRASLRAAAAAGGGLAGGAAGAAIGTAVCGGPENPAAWLCAGLGAAVGGAGGSVLGDKIASDLLNGSGNSSPFRLCSQAEVDALVGSGVPGFMACSNLVEVDGHYRAYAPIPGGISLVEPPSAPQSTPGP